MLRYWGFTPCDLHWVDIQIHLCLNHLHYKTGDLCSQVLQMEANGVLPAGLGGRFCHPQHQWPTFFGHATLTCTCKGSGNIVSNGGQVHCLCNLSISVWPTNLEHSRFALASLALLDNRHGQPEKVWGTTFCKGGLPTQVCVVQFSSQTSPKRVHYNSFNNTSESLSSSYFTQSLQ